MGIRNALASASLLTSMIASLSVLPQDASATQLISNSDFSVAGMPSLANWNPSGNVEAFSDASLKGVAPGLTGVSPNGTFADFNPNDASFVASLAQSFRTVAGESYSVGLLYGAVIDFEGSTAESQELGVFITDGTTLLLNRQLVTFGDENLSTAFSPSNFSFNGDGGVDTLTFSDESAVTHGINGVLTDVTVNSSVSAVPEPSTWAMMLMGFAGLILGVVVKALDGRLLDDRLCRRGATMKNLAPS